MNHIVPHGGGYPDEAIDLFPHYQDEGGTTPEAIAEAAYDIELSALAMPVLATDLQATHRPAAAATHGDLQTPIADAPTGPVERLGGVEAMSLCASGSTRLFGTDGVLAYNDLVDGLRSEYADRKAEIMASDCDVADVDYPKGATESERAALDEERDAEIQAGRQERLADLVRELQGRQEEYRADPLDAEAERAATRLKEGPTEEVMKELFASGALPSSAVDALPGYNLDEVPLDEWPPDLKDASDEEKAAWLLDHPEQGAVLAGKASDDVIEIMGEELADQARDIDSKSDADELEALDKALNAWGMEVNAQFVKALGGDELVQLVSTLDSNVDQNDDNLEAAATLAETLQASAQDASWDLGEEDAREIARDMVKAVVEPETGERPVRALSFLLDDGRYGTEFLETVGDELDEFERSDDFPDTGWQGMTDPHGVGELFGPRELDAPWDPMVSYMTALGNNGEASLEFFTEGDDREKYYISERFWSHDNFDGLLQALDAATTDDQNLDDPDAARLVSDAVHYLVNRSDNFGGFFGNGGECFEPGDIGDEGADALAHMMGTYMAAVDYANYHPGADYPDSPGLTSLSGRPDLAAMDLANMPVFDDDELRVLFQTAVSNDEGFIAMREAVSNYENYHLGVILEHYGEDGFESTPDHPGMWAHATDADARLEGLLLSSIGEVEIADGKEQDQQIKAWIQLGNDLAGAIPTPAGAAGSAVDFLSGQALNLGTDALEKAFATSEAKAWASAEDAAEDALGARSTGIVSNLHEAGVVSDEDIEAAARTAFEAAPPEGFDNFNDWYIQYFPGPGAAFPDSEDVSGDATLSAALASIANSQLGFDTGRYQLHYENAFGPYFPEPK